MPSVGMGGESRTAKFIFTHGMALPPLSDASEVGHDNYYVRCVLQNEIGTKKRLISTVSLSYEMDNKRHATIVTRVHHK